MLPSQRHRPPRSRLCLLQARHRRARIERALDTGAAAIILQNPNFFGAVDDFSDVIANNTGMYIKLGDQLRKATDARHLAS